MLIMAKRKMKFVQSPEDLVKELQGNKKSRITAMKEVRDQCCGSRPRKEAFFESDVMAVLLSILKDAVGQDDDRDSQEALITCLHLFASLAQAEPLSIPHVQVKQTAHAVNRFKDDDVQRKFHRVEHHTDKYNAFNRLRIMD